MVVLSALYTPGMLARRRMIAQTKRGSGIAQYSVKSQWNFWGEVLKNRAGIKSVIQSKLNDFPDAFTPHIIADLGYDIFPLPSGQLKMDHVLDSNAQGGAHTGTRWGSYGISVSPDAPYNSFNGITGFWWYIFSLHETINVWTGAIAGGWVWADGSSLWGGSSPFPNLCDVIITGEMGLTDISQTQHNRLVSDPRYVLLYNIQQQYGWKAYQVLFQLTRQYGITDWTQYAEPLRTAITVLFLSSGAYQSSGVHTNLLSNFQAAGIAVTSAAYLEAQLMFPNVQT